MSNARANARAAVVSLFAEYRDLAGEKAIIYPGRPGSIHVPQGFIDLMTEADVPLGNIVSSQRTLRVELVILHGKFDSGDSVANADRFADGLIDWVSQRRSTHAAGSNTTIGVIAIDDEPTFVPDWLPPESQATYFGSRVTLEVYDPG